MVLNQWVMINQKKNKIKLNFMLKLLKKIDWENVINVVGYVFIIAVGTLLFGFAFVFARAILQAL